MQANPRLEQDSVSRQRQHFLLSYCQCHWQLLPLYGHIKRRKCLTSLKFLEITFLSIEQMRGSATHGTRTSCKNSEGKILWWVHGWELVFLSKPGTLFPQNSLSSPLDTDTCCALGKESCSIKPFISNFCHFTEGCRIRGALCSAKEDSTSSFLILFAWCKSQGGKWGQELH